MTPLDQLKSIRSALAELDYSATLLEISEDVPLDMLSVELDCTEDKPYPVLTIAFYPMDDDLDEARFVQFYLQADFEVKPENVDRLGTEIRAANRDMPLGHFNLSREEDQLYFKYVLALPRNNAPDAVFIGDIVDMCAYAHHMLQTRFQPLA